HVDIDPAEIGKNLRPLVPIVGNAKDVLEALLQKVEPKQHPLWMEQIQEWKEKYPLRYADLEDETPCGYVLEELSRATEGKAIVTTDVGQHQMWASLFYKSVRPRGFLSSGGLGTMGFGFPAAIGAQFGCPEETVLAIVGDGGFQMTLQEMATAVEHHLPVKIALMHNGYLGMVRQWQELFSQRRYSAVDLSCGPDFVRLAEAYGAAGFRAVTKSQVREVIEKGMAVTDRPCLMEFAIAQEENVMPMIPSGGTVHQMMISDPKLAARLEEKLLTTA
ncbi:MAG: acetolactate synthase large subunit, partial [Armatimonadetes bacterium]|nr:acetolactate synthase large subunit [Armatimonadota bacterium]